MKNALKDLGKITHRNLKNKLRYCRYIHNMTRDIEKQFKIMQDLERNDQNRYLLK